MCEVLEEMRKACKVGNYSYMLGLIEEVQTMGNRMEASLWDQKALKCIREEIEKAEKELKDVKEKVKSKPSV